jgi:hypothetical protein
MGRTRAGNRAARTRSQQIVNGAGIFLKSGAGKFPSLAGWRSGVGVIGSSVF